jgi:hypothetical protein
MPPDGGWWITITEVDAPWSTPPATLPRRRRVGPVGPGQRSVLGCVRSLSDCRSWDDEHRAGREVKDVAGNAAQDEGCKTGLAAVAHHNQVGPELARGGHDLMAAIAGADIGLGVHAPRLEEFDRESGRGGVACAVAHKRLFVRLGVSGSSRFQPAEPAR